ncbi:MAG: protein disulfide oxidoreductase [Candidatus Thiodiazotropha sp. (ex Monitilora ramsayi)]|nr:protein disulfide oxidoreductase [Candidatus Thiodiazotropha sp. (ex Monitilora ramsayi)]
MTPISRTETAWNQRLIRWLLEGLALILALYLLHLWQTWDAAEGHAPALSGHSVTGGVFSLKTQREKPLLVYFWASWCPICGISSSSIDKLAKHHDVITIAMQSGSENELMRYLKKEGLNFPVISDPQSRIAKTWGVKGVPTAYVVDKQNNIRFVSAGYTTPLGLKARMWLAEL